MTIDLGKTFEKQEFDSILGQKVIKAGLKSAILAGRNLAIVGPPGVGKTSLAKTLADALPQKKGVENFVRVQGSPDLTAEDLIGDIDPMKALKFGPLSKEAFVEGKIFKANGGVLFFDELNRCPEKLQNALLQVLEEKKATIGSYDVDIDANFIFIATMNPEDSSTEKLSDVLLDRFDVLYMSYPESLEIEKDIVLSKKPDFKVAFPDNLLTLAVDFVRRLRESDKIEKKPSVRASIGLYERALANAHLAGKKKVDFKHIKDAVNSVISHRIRLKPSIKYLESAEDFVAEEFKQFVSSYKDLSGKKEDEGDVP
jgi:MoxR-like ATPase